MNIVITKPAVQWFKDEFEIEGEQYIRFFARYGGCGSIQSGFSLGISLDIPKEIGAKEEIDNITFYVEKEDLWYFKGYDIKVKYSRKHGEIEFVYDEAGE
ncbi:HesB/YadR/YfhF family protein [Halalkalibacterium ligniniphilum]|uniref:HesB/YadR/YfhF family protein n=1 Tax=Halalkalibacterium ligniniphilum TaxID=1134413 RepID=UPI00034B2FC2|nr:HesB/YadR/YfhF family protein [Halalkalibacterium ligniniphilum]